MGSFDLVVFDLDGTLVNSHPAILSCFQHAFSELELPYVGDEAVAALIGLPLMQMVETLAPSLDRAGHLALVESYSLAYPDADRRLSAIFDGIEGLLEDLKNSGATLAIATSKSQRGLDRVLRETPLSDWIAIAASNDTVENKKPNPDMLQWVMRQASAEPSQVAMIGDTSFDVRMGCSAGAAQVVGVTWGAHDAATLEAAGAGAVVSSVDELRDVLGI